MSYLPVDRQDHQPHHDHLDDDDDDEDDPSIQSHGPLRLGSLAFDRAPLELFWDQNTNNQQERPLSKGTGTGTGLAHLVNSITSRSTHTTSSYAIVEEDDYAEESRDVPGPTIAKRASTDNIPRRPHPVRPPRLTSSATAAEVDRPKPNNDSENRSNSSLSALSSSRGPIVRTASGRSLALRHPTPDLQALQGAYTGNIEVLERTAERLSMTSSIDDAIRELHSEQKRNDSRRSSLLSSPDLPAGTRQFSNASSIVETNNIARSGGYSPAGFMMSPKGSFSTTKDDTMDSGRGRSASKSSKYGARPEPELEGRPLDSFVSIPMVETTSPLLSRNASIDEQDGDSNTLNLPTVDFDKPITGDENSVPGPEKERPATSASNTTFDQAQSMFADFDGVHSAPQQKAVAEDGPEIPQQRVISGTSEDRQSVTASDVNDQRRVSTGNRFSMARPQSYADPNTGQQMVYYPAPVPMMLNLPQKLSKMPSSMARNKRRTQVLSTLPPAARKSAIWLPDVLEAEDERALAEDDGAQDLEYVPQHQRMTMGGRRATQDIQHLPPQLRATVFFDLPGPSQAVELKEQSAVATLDSILDASAHAPVNAFTDHAFAGHLGAEVYGKSGNRNSRSTSQLLAPEPAPKKRISSFNLLKGRRASSGDLLETENEKKRANTISDIRAGRIIRDPLDEDEDEGAMAASENGDLEDEEEEEEEVYHGAPTTLLAELQLRKQQAKQRTRPLASAYPNGIRSTLLQLDAVAQVEQKSRKQKRIHLAWEDGTSAQDDESGDDDDVPLALLYANKSQVQEPNRPLGLMERREMEDNEPLSRRRDRLQGRPRASMPRASTMMNLSAPAPEEEEGETLAQRVQRLKDENSILPSTRPVSGDFASEMLSQFGDLDVKGKGKAKDISPSPGLEEEETLGQRRKRLQAEREARTREVGSGEERPKLQNRRSMADILSAHPAAGASRVPSYGKEPSSNGLLGLHEREKLQRASRMFNPEAPYGSAPRAGGFKAGQYNDGQGGIIPLQPQMQRASNYNMFASPTAGFVQQGYGQQMGYNAFGNQMMMPFANPYAMGGMQMNGMGGMNMGYMQPNPMASMNMLQMGTEPLNQGQIDMVERWRQSVMQ